MTALRLGLLPLVMAFAADMAFAGPLPLCRQQFVDADLVTAPTIPEELLRTFLKGTPDLSQARSFAKQINALETSEKQYWLSGIGEVYRKVPKIPPPFQGPSSGRRSLDLITSLVQNSHLPFRELPPREAYAKFYSEQSKIFASEISVGEIYFLLSYFQSQLKVLDARKTHGPAKLYLGGSLVNGKALKGSDIDLSMVEAHVAQWFPIWQKELEALFQEKGFELKPQIEAHGFSPSQYGILNPMVFEITAKRIRLNVFPPARLGNTLYDLQAAKPDVYEFEID